MGGIGSTKGKCYAKLQSGITAKGTENWKKQHKGNMLSMKFKVQTKLLRGKWEGQDETDSKTDTSTHASVNLCTQKIN